MIGAHEQPTGRGAELTCNHITCRGAEGRRLLGVLGKRIARVASAK
jgi:hypothetical protein